MNARQRKAKARKFLVYRAWKRIEDPEVKVVDIARVVGLTPGYVSTLLNTMGLPHNSSHVSASFAGIARTPVDTFMKFNKLQTSGVIGRERAGTFRE